MTEIDPVEQKESAKDMIRGMILALSEGDILTLQSKPDLSAEEDLEYKTMMEAAIEKIGKKNPCLILTSDMDIRQLKTDQLNELGYYRRNLK